MYEKKVKVLWSFSTKNIATFEVCKLKNEKKIREINENILIRKKRKFDEQEMQRSKITDKERNKTDRNEE